MKATEFRIGNIINKINRQGEVHLPIPEPPFVICTISYGELECVRLGEIPAQVEEWIKIKVTDASPIHITEKWLIDLGFEKRGSYWHPIGSWHRYLFHGHCLNLEPEGGIVPHAQIRYVHELQNLYFALTQKEANTK